MLPTFLALFLELGVSTSWQEYRLQPTAPRESIPMFLSLVIGTFAIIPGSQWGIPVVLPGSASISTTYYLKFS